MLAGVAASAIPQQCCSDAEVNVVPMSCAYMCRLQEGCAAAATVAIEVLHGASPAWQDTSCLLGPAPDIKAVSAPSGAAAMASSPAALEGGTCKSLRQPGAAAANGGARIGPSTGAAATAEVARCTELLLELLSGERLAGLPTHAEAAATAAAANSTSRWRADGSAGGTMELAAHRWTSQVSVHVHLLQSELRYYTRCAVGNALTCKLPAVPTECVQHWCIHQNV